MSLPNDLNNLKRPPQSGEAELSLLGALLIDNNAWEFIADIVTENDFYNLENKLIFKSINDLLVKNKPADVVTVYDQLKSSAKIEEIGGLNYLNELVNSTPSSANIKRYAEIVRDKSDYSRKKINVFIFNFYMVFTCSYCYFIFFVYNTF